MSLMSPLRTTSITTPPTMNAAPPPSAMYASVSLRDGGGGGGGGGGGLSLLPSSEIGSVISPDSPSFTLLSNGFVAVGDVARTTCSPGSTSIGPDVDATALSSIVTVVSGPASAGIFNMIFGMRF